MKSRLIGFAFVAVVASGCVAGDETEESGSAIVNGQVEPGFPAVGAIYTNLGACTATLVAPRVILSAKHCIGPNAAPNSVEFRTGQNAETVSGHGVQLYFQGGVDDFQPDGLLTQDFLVVRLDQDVNIAPMPYRQDPMSGGEAGMAVLHVGYGVTGAGAADNGTRRSGGGTIEGVQGATFTTARGGAATVCFGDSGGPVFLDGVVTGIANGTYEPFCTDRSIHARVDQYTAMVAQAIADAGGGPGDDGPGDDGPGDDGPGDDGPGDDGPGDDGPGDDGPGDDGPGDDGPGDDGGVCEDYEYNCDDGRDDDCDGLADCDDPACYSSCGLEEAPDDGGGDDGGGDDGGVDDGGDGGLDDDPGVCEEYEWDCDDGADDDCNGLTDCEDPACETSC